MRVVHGEIVGLVLNFGILCIASGGHDTDIGGERQWICDTYALQANKVSEESGVEVCNGHEYGQHLATEDIERCEWSTDDMTTVNAKWQSVIQGGSFDKWILE